MFIFQIASTVPLLIGNPKAVSFGLLFILAAVVLISILSVFSAVFEMLLYAGSASLIIGIIFYASDALSFAAGLAYVASLFSFV